MSYSYVLPKLVLTKCLKLTLVTAIHWVFIIVLKGSVFSEGSLGHKELRAIFTMINYLICMCHASMHLHKMYCLPCKVTLITFVFYTWIIIHTEFLAAFKVLIKKILPSKDLPTELTSKQKWVRFLAAKTQLYKS